MDIQPNFNFSQDAPFQWLRNHQASRNKFWLRAAVPAYVKSLSNEVVNIAVATDQKTKERTKPMTKASLCLPVEKGKLATAFENETVAVVANNTPPSLRCQYCVPAICYKISSPTSPATYSVWVFTQTHVTGKLVGFRASNGRGMSKKVIKTTHNTNEDPGTTKGNIVLSIWLWCSTFFDSIAVTKRSLPSYQDV